jgi:hypothetical protein
VARWHELIGDPTLGDTILGRVIHRGHRIELKGPSLRKRDTVSAPVDSASLMNAQEKRDGTTVCRNYHRDRMPLARCRSGQRKRTSMITGFGVHNLTDWLFMVIGIRAQGGSIAQNFSATNA